LALSSVAATAEETGETMAPVCRCREVEGTPLAALAWVDGAIFGVRGIEDEEK
jgi:hypothetical protein